MLALERAHKSDWQLVTSHSQKFSYIKSTSPDG